MSPGSPCLFQFRISLSFSLSYQMYCRYSPSRVPARWVFLITFKYLWFDPA